VKELVSEFLLRLAKVAAATVLGVLIYLVAVGPLGASPTAELWLLSWLCGAAAVLLLESSPI
jgi:beta-lactamase regulating signal transducer with metallopeptidase domain